LPIVAAHFFYQTGWAGRLQYAFPDRNPLPFGMVGQLILWMFPLMVA
jgi:hypothetical protein